MKLHVRRVGFLIFSACCTRLLTADQGPELALRTRNVTPLTAFMHTLVSDMLSFNNYLFLSADTYKILLLSSPWYMAGRAIDAPVHAYFYNKHTHRNIHQIAPVFKYGVDPVMGVSLTTLILLQFFSHDTHTRKVSQTFLAALPFLSLYKDVLKALHFKGAVRPKNQCFNAHKTYYGGFPSGHMWEATLMAYLFGAELGPNYAVPLSAFALVVAAQSVAINRHTVSQVVAGAALGIAFGAACQNVVHRTLHRDSSCAILVNGSRGIGLTFEKLF